MTSFIGVAPSPPERRDRVHRHHGHRGAGEGEPEEGRERGHPEDRHRQHHRERRAGVDAEDAGVGQRVAGEALHQGPGEPEGGADGEGQAGAGDRAIAIAWPGSEPSRTAPGEIVREPTRTDSTDATTAAATRTVTAVVVRVRPAVASRAGAVSRTSSHQLPSTASATSGTKFSIV